MVSIHSELYRNGLKPAFDFWKYNRGKEFFLISDGIVYTKKIFEIYDVLIEWKNREVIAGYTFQFLVKTNVETNSESFRYLSVGIKDIVECTKMYYIPVSELANKNIWLALEVALEVALQKNNFEQAHTKDVTS